MTRASDPEANFFMAYDYSAIRLPETFLVFEDNGKLMVKALNDRGRDVNVGYIEE